MKNTRATGYCGDNEEMSMTSARDLISNLLTNSGPIERVGIFEHFWPETILAWATEGYPVPEASESGTANLVNPADHFAFDMRMCGGWFDIDPIQGFEEIVAESDEWIIKRNGAGASLKYWKHKSGTPEHVDFRMLNRAVWERDYRGHLLQFDRRRLESGSWRGGRTLADDRAELAKSRATKQWSFFGHVFIWEAMRQDMGDICMFESLSLDPSWIHDFNRVYTDFYKAHFRGLFDELGQPDGIWIYEDLAYRNGLFASPRVLRDLVVPYHAELVGFFHSHGLPVVLHCCGNITEGIPLVIEAGFDALQPMEIKAGCQPLAFAEQYHDRLAFIGGLDARILETNDRGTIERAVIELVEGMKDRGARYVFHSDHSISPRVKYDSYQWAVEAYRRHMAY